MFAQFEEGNLLYENRNDAESGDKPDDNSVMSPLLSKEEMDVMDSGDESNDDTMSKETLEEICDISQSHMDINRREAHNKIRDCIKHRKLVRKGAFKIYTKHG